MRLLTRLLIKILRLLWHLLYWYVFQMLKVILVFHWLVSSQYLNRNYWKHRLFCVYYQYRLFNCKFLWKIFRFCFWFSNYIFHDIPCSFILSLVHLSNFLEQYIFFAFFLIVSERSFFIFVHSVCFFRNHS